MRIAAIAKPHSVLTSERIAAARSRTWESVAGDCTRPARTERRKDETDFEDLHGLGSEPVRIRVFRDGGSCRSRRRILHYEWRSNGSWLRLSEHGGVPGRIRRYRRHVHARFLVQERQRLHGLSIEAITSVAERTRRELTGRPEHPIRMVRPPGSISEAATASGQIIAGQTPPLAWRA